MMGTKKNLYFRAGFTLLMFFILVAVFAPLISPFDPHELGIPYQKPNAVNWLGTNDIGQDIFSELIYGTRVSLFIGLSAAFIVTVIGTLLGILSGYCGGFINRMISGIINLAMSIPDLPLTIILVAFLNTSIWNIIIAICITSWTGTARVVRARVMQLREMPFVKIEKTLGASNLFIMIKHIIPNLTDIILMRCTLAISNAMLTEAGLSFLGLGVYNQKSWGGILHYAFYRSGIINNYYWWYLPPIVCISLCTLGFTLLGYYGKTKSSEKL